MVVQFNYPECAITHMSSSLTDSPGAEGYASVSFKPKVITCDDVKVINDNRIRCKYLNLNMFENLNKKRRSPSMMELLPQTHKGWDQNLEMKQLPPIGTFGLKSHIYSNRRILVKNSKSCHHHFRYIYI